MAREILTVPRSLVRSSAINWTLDHRGQDAGPTTNNINQMFTSAFPHWTGQPKLHLHRSAILHWRAVVSMARGRERVIRLPMIDPLGTDWAAMAGSHAAQGVPFSEGQTFSNGLGFAYTPFGLAVGAHAIGATQITVDYAPTGTPVQMGQRLSHDDWPFEVVAVLDTIGTEQTLQVEPCLRSAVGDGDTIYFEAFGLFELVNPAGASPHYARDHRARPEIALREVVTR